MLHVQQNILRENPCSSSLSAALESRANGDCRGGSAERSALNCPFEHGVNSRDF
jgi:hypothetical protein